MDQDELDRRLSQISTAWTTLDRAHSGPADAASEAQRRVLRRYGGAIYRYLLGATRDPEAADELFQEFALRFVRGDFRRADPRRGRFRDFLKTALYHLIVDTQRARGRRPLPLADGADPADPDRPQADNDREFLDAWRAELIELAWNGLADAERQSGQPLYTVLRFRTDHPDLRSHQVAEQLTRRSGQARSAEWVRKWLQKGRERFSDLLLEAVADSLGDSKAEAIEQELIDLSLLEYCRPALDRLRGR
jgi:RNA polymerase sigma-70 factor (ECF subfamily)